MASHKKNDPTTSDDAFEIVELASADIETLARAFNVISEVCEEQDDPSPSLNTFRLDYLVN